MAGVGAAAPAGTFANQPAGWSTIDDQPWNSTIPTGWIDDAGNGGTAFSIVTDSSAPISPSNVNAGLFNSGNAGGSAPFYLWRHINAVGYHSIYMGIAMKHSSNFDNTGNGNQAGGNAGTKFLWPAADQLQGTSLYMTFNSQTMDFGLNQQNNTSREMYANIAPTSNGQMVSKIGAWNIYEVQLGGNSNNSTADGTFDCWINGTKTHHYTDVLYDMGTGTTNATRLWQSLAWNPTYGGGLLNVPHDMWEYFDHLRILGN